MCGIAGIVQVTGRGVDRALLTAMTTAQAHRGPDGDGFVCRGGGGFGHRRLAIIDLVTADQPMPNPAESIWSVLNCHIYNYRELPAALGPRGARRVPRLCLRRGSPDDLPRSAKAAARLDADRVARRRSPPGVPLLEPALFAAAAGHRGGVDRGTPGPAGSGGAEPHGQRRADRGVPER